MTATESEDRDTSLVPDQTNDLTESPDEVLKQWLDLAKAGQRTTTGTMRKFVDAVDRVAPLGVVGSAKRREVISAALEMTERLVQMPYDFGRSLVQSAVNVSVNVDVDIASTNNLDPTERRG